MSDDFANEIRLVDSIGFELNRRHSEESWLVKWNDIYEIHTYKIDLVAFDSIALCFYEFHRDRWTEVTEEDTGFKDLVKILRQVFPSIPEDWDYVVAFPAFETNHRVLYKRD